MKTGLLRIAGIMLLLLGLGTVAALALASRLDDAAAQQAQDRLTAELQQASATPSTLPAILEDDPRIAAASPRPTVTTPDDDAAAYGTSTTVPLPGIVAEPSPSPGEAVGRILIPSIGLDWVIIEGVTPDDLAQGPGHMPGTPLPGQPGNAVVSGHRTTYGAPFADLDLLEPGTRIGVETHIGTHTYEVAEVVVVAPDALWVTGQVPGAWLTLTTCHPEGSSQQRLVVFARLVDGPNAPATTPAGPAANPPPQPG